MPPKNQPPTATLTIESVDPVSRRVRVRGRVSDPEGQSREWRHAWGDDEYVHGSGQPGMLEHEYAADGEYVMTLTASDQKRNEGTATATVVIAAPPPPPPPPPPLQVTAPAAMTLAAPDSAGRLVTYPAPTISGGVAPYTVTGSPVSGSRFPVGTTSVSLTVRDAAGATMNVSFPITVTWTAPPQPTQPPAGGNDDFVTMAARPDTFLANGLRTQADIDRVAQTRPQTGWTYDPSVDAVRGVIDRVYPLDADIKPQLRFPINITDGNVVIVWDYLRPVAWLSEPTPFVIDGRTQSGLASLKAFQVTTGADNKISFEVRNHFNRGSAALNEVGLIDMRAYHDTLAPGTFRSRCSDGTNNSGVNCPAIEGNDSDTVQPMLARRFVHGGKWLRYALKIEANPGAFDYCSLWIIEEGGTVVQIYDRWGAINRGAIREFWFEEDASAQRAVGSPPLNTYGRNVWMGRNVIDMASLLRFAPRP